MQCDMLGQRILKTKNINNLNNKIIQNEQINKQSN